MQISVRAPLPVHELVRDRRLSDGPTAAGASGAFAKATPEELEALEAYARHAFGAQFAEVAVQRGPAVTAR